MNTYKVTATRQDGTQVSDNFTERTEAAARKSFKECYRHDQYTIDSIELIRTDAQASKQQERDTLEKIRKMVEELGPDSYLATAFAGCFEIADWNIDAAGADSMAGRAEVAAERAESYLAAIAEREKDLAAAASTIAGLEAEIEELKHPKAPPEPEITDQLLDDVVAFTDTYVYEVRAAVLKNIAAIAADTTLTGLLREYNARRQAEAEEYRRDIENAVRYGHEFKPSNHCLTHASSYRDVIYDLLRPYWSKIEEVPA